MQDKEKDQKFKALQLTIDKLEKTYGKGAIMKLSDEKVMDVPVISTGSIGLDLALGVGGIPKGRVIEVYGPESSGKTTLSMHCIIAEAQKKGVWLLLLMLSMLLTKVMLRNWGLIQKIYLFPSQTMESRP